MSSVAWLAGYLLALLTVPIVLSAVGFMEFRTGDFDVTPTLSVGATIFTAVHDAWTCPRFRKKPSKRFSLNLKLKKEFASQVRKNQPKRWLHWTAFLFGMLAVADTWLEMNVNEDGLVFELLY